MQFVWEAEHAIQQTFPLDWLTGPRKSWEQVRQKQAGDLTALPSWSVASQLALCGLAQTQNISVPPPQDTVNIVVSISTFMWKELGSNAEFTTTVQGLRPANYDLES